MKNLVRGLALAAAIAASAWTLARPGPARLWAPQREVALLTAFDENIRAGNLAPVWASGFRHGYGQPELEFRPPLPAYIAELALWGTGDPRLALNIAAAGLAAVAALGFFAWLVSLPPALAAELKSPWADGLAAAAYGLNPWLIHVVASETDYSQLAALALLPWLATSLVRLARRPTAAAFAGAALSFALLSLSHLALPALAALFGLVAAVACRASPGRIALAGGALATGAVASAFYWVPAQLESGLTRLAALPPEASVSRFLPALEFLAAGGAIAALGCGWGLLRWAGTGPALAWKRGRREFWKVSALLLAFSAACLYFGNRTAASAFERLPFPLALAPRDFVPLFVFFASALGALAALKELGRAWHWAVLGGLVVALAWLSLPRANLAPGAGTAYAGAERFAPAGAAHLPATNALQPLRFLRGRGEGSCVRRGPTRLDCDLLVVHPSLVQFSLLDYAGWQASVDGAAPAPTTRQSDPLTGQPLLALAPGNHVVRWQLGNTPVRLASKWASAVAWLALLVLLLQNKLVKRQALSPESV